MKIRLNDPVYLDDLAEALLRGDCVVTAVAGETLDVSHPYASSRDEARVELAFFVKAWTAAHPWAEATLIA